MADVNGPRLARAPAGPRAQPSTSRPSNRVGTVAPATGVSCWICMASEPEPGDRFVHACSCSLVACESCLLTWIASTQRTAPASSIAVPPHRRAVRCPQCTSVFRIIQRKDRTLNVLAFVDSAWSQTALPTVVVGVGLGAALIGTQYSRLAIRAFFGPRVTSLWLGPPASISWPLLATVITSVPLAWLVPFGLIGRHPGLAIGWLAGMSFIALPRALALPAIAGLDGHVAAGCLIHYTLKGASTSLCRRIVPQALAAIIEPPETDDNVDGAMLSASEVHVLNRVRDFFALPFIAAVGGQGLLAMATWLGGPKPIRAVLGLAEDRAWAAATGIDQTVGDQWTSSLSAAFGFGTASFSTIDPVWIRNFVAAEIWCNGKRLFDTWRRVRLYRQLTSRKIKGVPVTRHVGL